MFDFLILADHHNFKGLEFVTVSISDFLSATLPNSRADLPSYEEATGGS